MNNKINDNIDLIELLRNIFKSKKVIAFTTLCFMLCGVIYSLVLPHMYTSTTIFIPQNQEFNNSSLSGVANLVGINVGSQSTNNEIPLTIYPKIFNSPEFKRSLLNSHINLKNTITLKKYISEEYELEINTSIAENEMFVSESEEEMFNILNSIVKVIIDLEGGFVTISSTIKSAEYSAMIAKNAREILQEIIIRNRIEKAKQTLEFTENQLNERKKDFEKIQSKLSYFKDSNLNLVNNSYINEQNKLQAEFEVINAVVTDLSKQLEQAKIQVKRDSPIFSTIKEATIPNKKSSPKRKAIVLFSSFIGFFISTFYVISKAFFTNLFLLVSSK